MSSEQDDWLSLAEASARLGVHPTTLRRWADSGAIPCLRTPGAHRRFRRADLAAWMSSRQGTALTVQTDALIQNAVGYTRRQMAEKHIYTESWYLAFGQDQDREQMRATGRRLFGLAVQYIGRTRDVEPILQEGRRIGEFYGEQCAGHGISLVDTMRALFFFRESLLHASRPGQVASGQYDAEDVRIHRQLRHFLDEVMYACLGSYDSTCRKLFGGGAP